MENLESFGQEFIEKVLSLSLEDYVMIKSGKMKSSDAMKIHDLYASFNNLDAKKIDAIVVEIVERVLRIPLRMFEESEEFTIMNEKDHEDIVQLSDGLAGELYGEYGWMAKYGKNNL